MEETLSLSHLIQSGEWLPYTFAFLMGFSILIYTLLDGYDLGVGILSDSANWEHRNRMIASIGPFWDANETWLVLSVGLLLVAFPLAQGHILGHLYLPVALMLFGLIFRGVAFDFRAKVPYQQKWRWDLAFFLGSLVATLCQGYMLGYYITGFESSWIAQAFSVLIALCLVSAYCLLGACWIIMKCEGGLQRRAVDWAKYHLINTVLGIVFISITTPIANSRIEERWFSIPNFYYILPIPCIVGVLVISLYLFLKKLPLKNDRLSKAPFFLTAGIFVASFIGLAYSFFPYIIPEKLKIVDAASAPKSLMFMLVGALIVLPILLGYTVFVYRVFKGKAADLSYE